MTKDKRLTTKNSPGPLAMPYLTSSRPMQTRTSRAVSPGCPVPRRTAQIEASPFIIRGIVMRRSNLRAGRAPLAIVATALIAVTTAACAGDQPITAPPAHPNAPSDAVRDVASLEADSTRITFTIDRVGERRPASGGPPQLSRIPVRHHRRSVFPPSRWLDSSVGCA